jgi:hypothetical protein
LWQITAKNQESRLRTHVLALAAALFVSNSCFAQTSSASRPASAPAAAPALSADQQAARETAARIVVRDFIRAMFAGDNAALSFLSFTDSQSKSIGESLLGEVLAEQRLRKAVTAAFGDKPLKVGRSDADIADFEKNFANATVKVSSDGGLAIVSMPLGISYVAVFKDNKGLVDFDKTQSNVGPLPKMNDIEALSKMTTALDQLAKDVAAKKYGSIEEVNKEVDAILALRSAAQPRAAEVPAAGAAATTRGASTTSASRP